MGYSGRPFNKIDWDLVISLCQIFCTQLEISRVIGVSVDSLSDACPREQGCTFPEFFGRHSTGGKVSLRRAQFKSAVENLNPTMLIWLGKQHLAQADKVEHIQEVNNNTIVHFTRDK